MNSTQKIDLKLLKTMPLPNWDEDTSKFSRGKLLIIGGSRRLPGAVILAARAALRIGCGTVRVAAPESVAVQIGVAVPELMVLPLPETSHGTISASAASKLLKEQMKVCTAIVLGPGIDEDKDTEKAICELLAKAPLPMVVDAQVGILGILPNKIFTIDMQMRQHFRLRESDRLRTD
jgi:ADP-dependent NAD(P)H-hydrate dehydratase